MSSLGLKVVLHAAAAAIMAYGYGNIKYTPADAWIRQQKGGHSQFLTILGLGIAWLTMILSLVSDFVPAIKAVRWLKRTLLMVAMPVSFVISSIYWSMLIFVPEKILMPVRGASAFTPEQGVPSSSTSVPQLYRIPLSMDLALHAVPAISLLLDFALFERKYTKKQAFIGGLLACAAAGTSYGYWVEYLATFNGTFPYPFLTDNPPHIRQLIYAGASSGALVMFWILNALHP
ncbi:hypothetical protein SCP_0404110 [Sparassis crispa]|uniref:Uncharacterized protein n=1 Tax=Sparassis crispa TaxID=139825 RepID=A0A401GIV4_9APHY|nr:hypothetical protein SCP_0404110 [Sparassis crispa]GBE82035.1 hypothetical protein SCP_0404110 [Sparassis crispa]